MIIGRLLFIYIYDKNNTINRTVAVVGSKLITSKIVKIYLCTIIERSNIYIYVVSVIVYTSYCNCGTDDGVKKSLREHDLRVYSAYILRLQ